MAEKEKEKEPDKHVTKEFRCGKETIHMSASITDGEFHFFATQGKNGECRRMTLSVTVEFINKTSREIAIDCLQHHSCEGQIAGMGNCCAAMAKLIKKLYEKEEPEKEEPEKEEPEKEEHETKKEHETKGDDKK